MRINVSASDNKKKSKVEIHNKILVGSQIRLTRQRKRTSQSKKQHFKSRERKQRDDSIHRLLAKEGADILKRTQLTEESALNRIETAYVFVADYRKSKLHNTSLYLASMGSWYYFDRPNNL